jgi:hypothetical protein
MKVAPIITQTTSLYKGEHKENRPISPFDNNLNEETNLKEDTINKQFEMVNIQQQHKNEIESANRILNEDDLRNVNISILTDYNNVTNNDVINNGSKNNKEMVTVIDDKKKGGDKLFYKKQHDNESYVIPTFVDESQEDSLKKIKRTEKCIKRIIFFLLIVFFCSVLYLLLRDLITFE